MKGLLVAHGCPEGELTARVATILKTLKQTEVIQALAAGDSKAQWKQLLAVAGTKVRLVLPAELKESNLRLAMSASRFIEYYQQQGAILAQ